MVEKFLVGALPVPIFLNRSCFRSDIFLVGDISARIIFGRRISWSAKFRVGYIYVRRSSGRGIFRSDIFLVGDISVRRLSTICLDIFVIFFDISVFCFLYILGRFDACRSEKFLASTRAYIRQLIHAKKIRGESILLHDQRGI